MRRLLRVLFSSPPLTRVLLPAGVCHRACVPPPPSLRPLDAVHPKNGCVGGAAVRCSFGFCGRHIPARRRTLGCAYPPVTRCAPRLHALSPVTPLCFLQIADYFLFVLAVGTGISFIILVVLPSKLGMFLFGSICRTRHRAREETRFRQQQDDNADVVAKVRVCDVSMLFRSPHLLHPPPFSSFSMQHNAQRCWTPSTSGRRRKPNNNADDDDTPLITKTDLN